jgi:hypothetical protein
VAHPDEEELVLLALGENGAHAGHLDDCELCTAEVTALRRVAAVGVETQDVRDLPPPPDAVWNRIAAATHPSVPQPAGDDDAGRTASPRPDRTTGPAAANGPGTYGPARGPGRHRRMRRWAMAAATAVVALAVGVVGTLVVTRDREQPDTVACATVRARADLSALPLAPRGAVGEARVLCDGPDRRLHLHVTGLPLQPGYYEVWLIDPDSLEMTAIGQLGEGGDVLLPLASTTDLRKYRLVDISSEQYDNNQAHSGKSLLRGQLTI